jgi:hypothetical protein
MIRTLLVCASLATFCGCNASRKVATNGSADKTADPPKQYEYRDMSRGGNAAFAHPNPGATTMVR